MIMTTDASNRPRMRLVSFKAVAKGALRGFAHVELPCGLRIEDCPVFQSNGKAWASLPAKPVLDTEGRHVKPDGKGQYAAIVKWRDRDLNERWSAALVALIRTRHPHALLDQEAADERST
jgi:hypothetical protein